MTTRERILDEALRLFSEKGYDAVSVEQIAAAVGIRAPSLYKHFKGKQDIFDAVLAETARRYDAFTDSISVHVRDSERDMPVFEGISADDLVRRVRALVEYSLHDPYVSRFRRLVTIEQFRSPELSDLYSERYLSMMLRYHTGLFTRLIAAGQLQEEDPQVLAMLYGAPIQLLIGECDRHPEREAECLIRLEAHVRLFHRTYQKQ